MRTKLISVAIALLAGVSVWADDVWNYNVYDDCSKNGQTADIRPTGQENGYEWVNLGLPSGIKWASCNVGANQPEDYGNYYAWGEVTPKDDYSWSTYKYANGSLSTLTKYCSNASYGNNGFTDNKTTLDLEDDAAYMNWGGNWRMPTSVDVDELLDNCTWTWTTQNGVNGYRVTSKTNSNSIFLPAAGYRNGTSTLYVCYYGDYWSSSLYESNPHNAWYVNFGLDLEGGRYYYSRACGFSVRPVLSSSSTISASSSCVTLTLYANGCESGNVIKCNAGQQINIKAVHENEHRHFVRWSDGNTDNPRLVTVEKDTTFTAEFAYNQYTISTEVNNAEWGSVSGATTIDYSSEVTLTATANYGYHFVSWTDKNTDNPRTVQVTGDATYTAVFAKNSYTITLQADKGYISAPTQAMYLDSVTLSATAVFGYHFAQWSDGNTDNPRTIVLTCDTTFTAEFAQTYSGQCGDNLYWNYAEHTLTLSGTGTMYDYGGNDMPWLLFRDTTDAVVLEQGITHIGSYAFYDCTGLTSITIPEGVTEIGDAAFYGCVYLTDITLPSSMTTISDNAFALCSKLQMIIVSATTPPAIQAKTFYEVSRSIPVYVPAEAVKDYKGDLYWQEFNIQAASTTAIDQITADTDTTPCKVLRNGQVYILRNNKTYTLTGVEVE